MSEITNRSACVMVDVSGVRLSLQERDLLAEPSVGGVVLFSRNYQSPSQLAELCTSIHEVRPDVLIAVDQEGGRVQRFRDGFTQLPSMRLLGERYDQSPNSALDLAHDVGWLMATELKACGVDLSFAPVLDLAYGQSRVIGSRSFGADPAVVSVLAAALCAGMQEAGMCSVGKHFPGHGFVAGDSHVELPRDTRSWQALWQADLVPFARLIEQGLLQGVMPAHVVYPCLDAEHSAGFSTTWLDDVLGKKLGFTGTVFSDDLSMRGAASVGGAVERAHAAAAAGCHALLVCNDAHSACDVVFAVNEWYAKGMMPYPLKARMTLGVQAPEPDIDSARLARLQMALTELTENDDEHLTSPVFTS